MNKSETLGTRIMHTAIGESEGSPQVVQFPSTDRELAEQFKSVQELLDDFVVGAATFASSDVIAYATLQRIIQALRHAKGLTYQDTWCYLLAVTRNVFELP